MIRYHYEVNFRLENEGKFTDWITRVIESENTEAEEINYVFCTDDYLLEINQQYLGHDAYTDIITFDFSIETALLADIFISIERVMENAKTFELTFQEELLRVMSHGILHLVGYGDKTEGEARVMREKEEEKMKLFHVEL